jgi:transcriptional regulator with XRE-family HTH domain
MDIRKQVGLNIRRLRVEQGISQEALAADAEVERSYMGGLERGIRNPTVELLDRIARVLKVTVSDLTAPTTDRVIAGLPKGRHPKSRSRK